MATVTGAGRARLPQRGAALAVLLVGCALTVARFADPSWVDGSSMASTLRSGALVLVDRIAPAEVARGEVVIFRPPLAGYVGDDFVKRVIALPGETVSVRDGAVYVDDRRLAEPYLAAGERTVATNGALTLTVPAGAVFVLGDNRANSYDSLDYGPVPIANIVGRAWLELDLTAALIRLL